jgi:hypothetical protein
MAEMEANLDIVAALSDFSSQVRTCEDLALGAYS